MPDIQNLCDQLGYSDILVLSRFSINKFYCLYRASKFTSNQCSDYYELVRKDKVVDKFSDDPLYRTVLINSEQVNERASYSVVS